MKHIAVIGSGFAGLAAAASLAQKGHQVTVLEKNDGPGGRARRWVQDGFVFDMGPSWYWMPDVFERFFARFGQTVADHYNLIRLDPSYRVAWPEGDHTDLPANYAQLREVAEALEPGAARGLDAFLSQAEYKYQVGVGKLVYKPSKSLLEFADPELIAGLFRLQVFGSMSQHVRRYFRDPRLIRIMEFPVLFLGAMPRQTPALYSLMNYADIKGGTWYPQGGMHQIVLALVRLAESQGATMRYQAPVARLVTNGQAVRAVELADGEQLPVDGVVAAADYHHVDTQLLPAEHRQYTDRYWQSRTLAPSSLIFYLGLNTRVPELLHHNLFFDADFDAHARAIYDQPAWPDDPLFYACLASHTDPTAAPEGHENVFILIPAAVDLDDDDATRERYYHLVMDRLQARLGRDLRPHVVLKRSYAHRDFKADYHAYRGNAYGLANTLRQTAILKPRLHHRSLRNLLFAGQLTVPGPGVPPSLISGQVAAEQLHHLLA